MIYEKCGMLVDMFNEHRADNFALVEKCCITRDNNIINGTKGGCVGQKGSLSLTGGVFSHNSLPASKHQPPTLITDLLPP